MNEWTDRQNSPSICSSPGGISYCYLLNYAKKDPVPFNICPKCLLSPTDDPVYHTDKHFYREIKQRNVQVGTTSIGASKASVKLCRDGAGTKKGRGLEGWKGGLRFCKHDRNYMNHPNETQPSFLTKKQRRFSRRKQDCNDSRTTASFLKAFRHLIHFQNRALETHSSLASMLLPLILLSTQAVHSQLCLLYK